MADPANDTTKDPFTAFNFAVDISVPDVSSRVCNGAFSECDGLLRLSNQMIFEIAWNPVPRPAVSAGKFPEDAKRTQCRRSPPRYFPF